MFLVGVEKIDNPEECGVGIGSVCGAVDDIAPCRSVPSTGVKVLRRPGQPIEIHCDVPNAKTAPDKRWTGRKEPQSTFI